jgi:antirestriction protein ArdC
MVRKTVEIVPHPAGLSGYVAEIGASILGAHLGLPPDHLSDHASYVGHWMKLLKDDKRAFLSAAAQAQTSVDWLLAKSPPLETTNAPSTREAPDARSSVRNHDPDAEADSHA